MEKEWRRKQSRSIRDIRDYVKVYGKIKKDTRASCTDISNGLGRNSGSAMQVELRQPTLNDFIKKMASKKHCRRASTPAKLTVSQFKNGVPASLISRGVRKKANSSGNVPKRNSFDNKENVNPYPKDEDQSTTDYTRRRSGLNCVYDRTRKSPQLNGQAVDKVLAIDGDRVEQALYEMPQSLEVNSGINSDSQRQAWCEMPQSLEVNSRINSDSCGTNEEALEKSRTEPPPSSQSDVLLGYIDTHELLAELSYCEKITM